MSAAAAPSSRARLLVRRCSDCRPGTPSRPSSDATMFSAREVRRIKKRREMRPENGVAVWLLMINASRGIHQCSVLAPNDHIPSPPPF